MQGDVYSLTWRSPRGFRFDLKTLALKSEFRTPYRDGWGLAHDGRHFIVTDSGTDLFFLDPATMREVQDPHMIGFNNIQTDTCCACFFHYERCGGSQ